MEDAIERLVRYVEQAGFRGYDPYDALNSPVLRLLTRRSRWVRIGAIQSLKLLPLNVRPLLGIAKEYNPKGMGLFLSAYVRLYRVTREEPHLRQIEFLSRWLVENASKGYSGCCWGYNFPWQSRAFYVPRGTPTIVNTSFVSHAFLDAFETFQKEEYLQVARGACDFILKDLNLHREEDTLCFSYSPRDHMRVHNANYLGASLLARVAAMTGEQELESAALSAYAYGNAHQRSDGSWPYAESDYQGWIDSYHTGFNLEALRVYSKYFGPYRFAEPTQRGFCFYLDHFFLDDGTPKYYHDGVYPVDIHSGAQALSTLSHFRHDDPRALGMLNKVLTWTLTKMQDHRGYFYYRRGPRWVNRIPYIRWGQAWMLHGLTTVLEECCHAR